MFSSVPPAQKKKRRKSRWSTGYIAKKKSSPHVSKDDAQLGTDEDNEDGDDEDEVEKRGGTEGNVTGDDHMVVEAEPGHAAPQESSFEPNTEEQNGHEEELDREERMPAAEDEVVLCEIGQPQNEIQAQNKKDTAVKYQPGQSENRANEGGDENHETISNNTNENCTDTEGDGPNTATVERITKMQSETQIVKIQSAAQEQKSKVVSAEDAELRTPAEPMELDETLSPVTDAPAAAMSEADTRTG